MSTERDEDKLLPCPFCGCHAVKFESYSDGRHERERIKCEDCPGGMDFYSSTHQQAINAWNRRSTATTSSGDGKGEAE
jgi:Lar family restriction alleviation protein